jgi:putative ABC transport system permease protein
MTEVMNLSFTFLPVPALIATLAATALTITFGLVGTFAALGQKPAQVLRHL